MEETKETTENTPALAAAKGGGTSDAASAGEAAGGTEAKRSADFCEMPVIPGYALEQGVEMKPCKYCRIMVPKKARICPNCKKKLKRHWIRNLIIFLVIIALCGLGVYYYLYEYHGEYRAAFIFGPRETVVVQETVADLESGEMAGQTGTLEAQTAAGSKAQDADVQSAESKAQDATGRTAAESEAQNADAQSAESKAQDTAGQMTAGDEAQGTALLTAAEGDSKAAGTQTAADADLDRTEQPGGEAAQQAGGQPKVSGTTLEDVAKDGLDLEAEDDTDVSEAEEESQNQEEKNNQTAKGQDLSDEDGTGKEEQDNRKEDREAEDEKAEDKEDEAEEAEEAEEADVSEQIAVSEYSEEDFRDLCELFDYRKVMRTPEHYIGSCFMIQAAILEQIDGGLFDDNIYYLAVTEDEDGVERYYILRDDRGDDAMPLFEGDAVVIYGQMFDTCSLSVDYIPKNRKVPAVTIAYLDLEEE